MISWPAILLHGITVEERTMIKLHRLSLLSSASVHTCPRVENEGNLHGSVGHCRLPRGLGRVHIITLLRAVERSPEPDEGVRVGPAARLHYPHWCLLQGLVQLDARRALACEWPTGWHPAHCTARSDGASTTPERVRPWAPCGTSHRADDRFHLAEENPRLTASHGHPCDKRQHGVQYLFKTCKATETKSKNRHHERR